MPWRSSMSQLFDTLIRLYKSISLDALKCFLHLMSLTQWIKSPWPNTLTNSMFNVISASNSSHHVPILTSISYSWCSLYERLKLVCPNVITCLLHLISPKQVIKVSIPQYSCVSLMVETYYLICSSQYILISLHISCVWCHLHDNLS